MFKTDVRLDGTLNTPHSEIVDHVLTNIRRPLPQCRPHFVQKRKALIAAGGPSLRDSVEHIREKRAAGAALFCVNGTGRFLRSQDVQPSAQVVLDARGPQNLPFLGDPQPEIRYLLASQCHPMLFDFLHGYDVWIWHGCGTPTETAVLDAYYGQGRWFQIIGGSTVTLRTIWLCRMLGFRDIELFGFDSCHMGENHHAYAQKVDDSQKCIVGVGDREFICDLWHYSQAVDFSEMVRELGDNFDLIVHGDGLIANMMQTAARLQRRKERTAWLRSLSPTKWWRKPDEPKKLLHKRSLTSSH